MNADLIKKVKALIERIKRLGEKIDESKIAREADLHKGFKEGDHYDDWRISPISECHNQGLKGNGEKDRRQFH